YYENWGIETYDGIKEEKGKNSERVQKREGSALKSIYKLKMQPNISIGPLLMVGGNNLNNEFLD
ncbi:MAG: hypothetical protein NZ918_04490, partial [Aigarchaeota archaeon]|nr:hypothetical protein [Aigarchaeota archaeon]